MGVLVFYGKPGCVGNGMQQSLLRSQGVEVAVRDLLSHPWTAESLRGYFGETPVCEWFNGSAPRVKSGEIAIGNLSEGEALVLMLQEPLLIRRPLLELGELRQAGFSAGPVLDALEVVLDPGERLQDCPLRDALPVCEDRG